MLAKLVVAALVVTKVEGFCCFFPETADRCSNCQSVADSDNFCGGNRNTCESDCGHVWCSDAGSGSDTPDTASDILLLTEQVDTEVWTYGTYTTGYWDCCKPSCSNNNKGSVTKFTRYCDVTTGATLLDAFEESVCVGGNGAACADQQPFTLREGVSMGFAAAAVSSNKGTLKGDDNCGQCFELQWTEDRYTWGGGAHPEIVGWSHLVQVTNVGFDVSGEHSFDLQIPGAGQGLFNTACSQQFPGFSDGDFDCDNNYGGCDDVSGCARLPEELRRGCEWRYSPAYRWLQDNGQSNNPLMRYRRIKCPQELVDLSETRALDDDDWPEYTQTPAPAIPGAPEPKPTISPTPTSLRVPTAHPAATPTSKTSSPGTGSSNGGGTGNQQPDDDVSGGTTTTIHRTTNKKSVKTNDLAVILAAVAAFFAGSVLTLCCLGVALFRAGLLPLAKNNDASKPMFQATTAPKTVDECES
mmetsp:Transcript_29836/g.91356  ORF Transcript_29836/g.91356 Transcript_29836/m.91356 type:complete len:469 (+) Transcript_29836:38-1444(+)